MLFHSELFVIQIVFAYENTRRTSLRPRSHHLAPAETDGFILEKKTGTLAELLLHEVKPGLSVFLKPGLYQNYMEM